MCYILIYRRSFYWTHQIRKKRHIGGAIIRIEMFMKKAMFMSGNVNAEKKANRQ